MSTETAVGFVRSEREGQRPACLQLALDDAVRRPVRSFWVRLGKQGRHFPMLAACGSPAVSKATQFPFGVELVRVEEAQRSTHLRSMPEWLRNPASVCDFVCDSDLNPGPNTGNLAIFALFYGKWWLGAELNRRHKDFQSSALPTELPSRSHSPRDHAKTVPQAVRARQALKRKPTARQPGSQSSMSRLGSSRSVQPAGLRICCELHCAPRFLPVKPRHHSVAARYGITGAAQVLGQIHLHPGCGFERHRV